MKTLLLTSALTLSAMVPVLADAQSAPRAADIKAAVKSAADTSKTASFEILAAHIHRDGRTVTFHMTTNGAAGADRPKPVGKLAGAPVLSYVWPTSLDPATVGFEGKTGILALAATSHPDFDDTPLFDEDADGNPANDGAKWHSHWVVLTPTKACGDGALGVRDIADGAAPAMPATWPGLPVYIDSPGFTPLFDGAEIRISIATGDANVMAGASYDGVTAALQVSPQGKAPLLCVTDVLDIASGDLSLPGKVN